MRRRVAGFECVNPGQTVHHVLNLNLRAAKLFLAREFRLLCPSALPHHLRIICPDQEEQVGSIRFGIRINNQRINLDKRGQQVQ